MVFPLGICDRSPLPLEEGKGEGGVCGESALTLTLSRKERGH